MMKCKAILISVLLLFCSTVRAAESQSHHINFNDVPVIEFIRFVSKISHANFIFDHRELQFNVTVSSGYSVNSDEVVQALVQVLRLHGFAVTKDNQYFVIHRLTKNQMDAANEKASNPPMEKLIAGELPKVVEEPKADLDFSVYKLKYHQGNEIEEALKKISADMRSRGGVQTQKLLEAVNTIQWVKSTNSLLFSGEPEVVDSLQKLIKTLDVPLRQVFIEVLVVETDAKKTTEFGLQWVGGGKWRDKIGFGSGAFPASGGGNFARTAQGISAASPPSGLSQIPIGRGFDLGVIGDLIFHKGKSYLTLGGLVSALQMDGDTTIVLNQKIITQDNKNSKIFVGDNIPFTGSIVQTVGQGQQTTANIEYRDVGVNLSITPMLGEDEVISLSIDQEITEAVDDPQATGRDVEGIRTTKTNMATAAHVPNDHFLVLSGMVRNARSYQKSGLPCLGGLPAIGSAFSKTKKVSEKRNVIIFVRPHIINSFEDYQGVSEQQEGFEEINKSP